MLHLLEVPVKGHITGAEPRTSRLQGDQVNQKATAMSLKENWVKCPEWKDLETWKFFHVYNLLGLTKNLPARVSLVRLQFSRNWNRVARLDEYQISFHNPGTEMNGELRFLHSVKEEKTESKRYSRSLCPRAAFITYLSHLSPVMAQFET